MCSPLFSFEYLNVVFRQGRVRDIIYRGTKEQIQRAAMPDGKVPLVRLLAQIKHTF